MATGGRTPFENIRQLGFAANYPALIGSRDIHVAIRTDGQVGSGTKLDPFNCNGDVGLTGDALKASAATKLTTLYTTYQPDYNFHYAAGIYYTYGWKSGIVTPSLARKTAGDGCKHYAAGPGRTIITLYGADEASGEGVIFGTDYNVRSPGFELHDMTLDCDAANQPRWTAATPKGASAISIRPDNVVIDNVEVIRFGSKAGAETFVIFVDDNTTVGTYENALVKNCWVHSPVTGNTGGVSAIVVQVSTTGSIGKNLRAENNTVDYTGSSGFLYRHGVCGLFTRNNTNIACTEGFYLEPGVNAVYQGQTSMNDKFIDCDFSLLGLAQAGCTVEYVHIFNPQIINTTTSTTGAIRFSGVVDNLNHFNEIVLSGASMWTVGGALSSTVLVTLVAASNIRCENNVVNSSHSSQAIIIGRATSASTVSASAFISNNRNSAGKLLTCTYNDVATRQQGDLRVTFTPTTTGWYRIVSGVGTVTGTVRILNDYDGHVDDTVINFSSPGYGGTGSINQNLYSGYAGLRNVGAARISNNNSSGVYLDIEVVSSTSPGPITIVATGDKLTPAQLVVAPVAGAVSGGFGEKILALEHGVRTTHSVVGDHFVALGTVPTIAAGTGAGTSPTVSITGTDAAGEIVVTTGSAPATAATVVTVTFARVYSGTPKASITPHGANAAALSGTSQVWAGSESSTIFRITSGSVALTAATQYKWNYQVIG